MKQKSILEQALLQVENLEEAVKQNAKGILSSTMKQELNELLKESMEEEEEDSEKEPMPNEEEEKDMSEQPADEEGDEADDEMPSINDEPSKDVDSEDEDEVDSEEDETEDSDEDETSPMDDEMSGMDNEMPEMGDEESSMDDEMPGMNDDESSMDNDDVLDMSNASEDEVAKVFKAMGPKDGIIVKKDGNNIELSDEDDEYIIKLGDEVDHLSEEEEKEEWTEEEEEEADETVYEIELDEEEDEEEDSKSKEQEVGEAARTKSNVHGNKGPAPHGGLASKKKYKAGSGTQTVNEEIETLRKQNSEYKKALLLFKEKINEVAVFNANLAYATRLFTEHSTTKKEKMNILKRFDTISSINESKNLYNTIKTELETKKPVTEAVVDKIQVGLKTTSSTEVLSESKVYEAPQFARMKDLMKKIK